MFRAAARLSEPTSRRESRAVDRFWGYLSEMLNHGYIAQSLRRPLPTKDGGTLRTLADAANYIVALPEDRRGAHWDRTAQLILDLADARDQPPARTRLVL
jgi:hypothetical protein